MINFLKKYKFSVNLFFSIIIGSIIGIIFGESAKKIEFIGNIYINMLFVTVIPLVFCTITSSIANMNSLKRLGKIFKYMIIIFIFTSFISSLFMLLGVLAFKPYAILNNNIEYTKESINIGNKIVEMLTVNNFYELLSKNNMLPLIIFSILFGLSIKLCDKNNDNIKKSIRELSNIMVSMISIINKFAPIGLCAYFASLIGTYGKEFIGEYAKCFILYLIMALLYYVIFYTLYSYIAYKKRGVKIFYSNILLSTITSLGTCSSLATLPTNIKTCENMGLSKDVSKVVLPIGATIHMEGSCMASILKISFIFSILGKPFTGVFDLSLALLISLLSGIVMSGIPGGALIGEMLIVSLYGFPSYTFPLIATIGWIIDSPGTCLNAVGDIPSTMLIDKLVNQSKLTLQE